MKGVGAAFCAALVSFGCGAPGAAAPASPCPPVPATAPSGAATTRSPGRIVIVGPDGPVVIAEWSAEDQSKDVALRTLRTTDAASYHLVRLATAEKPHVHDRSDLSVVVLSGSVRMHFERQVVPLAPGDVVDIPKGALHWAENAASEPSLAYVVFAPAFDGKDRRFVDPVPAPSAPLPAPAP